MPKITLEGICNVAVWFCVLIAVAILFGCEDEKEGLKIDCSGGPLFDYGPQSVSGFATNGGPWYQTEYYTYTYESGVLVSSGVELYEDGYLTDTYERFMTWNDDDQLISVEYESEYGGMPYTEWQSFEYDESGNLIHRTSGYENDYYYGVHWEVFYTYNDENWLIEEQWGDVNPSGWIYEYDDVGRVTTRAEYGTYDGWEPTGNEYQYVYDENSRLIQMKYLTSYGSVWTETFTYDGNSPLVLEAERSDDRKRVFEWEGDTLTITYSSAGEDYYREIFEYAEEGDSSY